jgi:hypothetical protein
MAAAAELQPDLPIKKVQAVRQPRSLPVCDKLSPSDSVGSPVDSSLTVD